MLAEQLRSFAFLRDESVIIGILAVIAAILFLLFLYQYVIGGVRLYWQLRRLVRRVRSVPVGSNVAVKRALDELLRDSCVAFPWREYEETLHQQHSLVGTERQVSDIRATLPASAFINLETVVDSRIGSEFFKHLPGILTGLGIIGTFSGLIIGLLNFKPSVKDIDRLQSGLEGLLMNVQGAFMFSAVAILLAIFVTLIEKWLYSACAKWVGELVQALDARFRAGVGEEYLSSLVQASQESATQIRQLKESMVDDLKVLLTNLTDRQIAATRELGVEIGRQLESGLKDPLQKLADTVSNVSGEQTQAAGAILENLMASFMAQMRETLGGQLGGLSSLMQQTASSMTQVELTLRSLVSDMQRASQESSSGVRAAMSELLQKLAEHQESQSRAVQTTATSVLGELQTAVAHMAGVQEAASARSQAAVEAVAVAMTDQVQKLAGASAEAIAETRNVIDRLGSVSTESFDRLAAAAAAVSAAVGGVQATMEKMTRVAAQLTVLEQHSAKAIEQVTEASTNLGAASLGVARGLSELTATTTRLESIAAHMSTEQEQRAALLAEVERLLQTTRSTGQEFTRLTEEVKGALQGAFEQFGTGVSKNLSQHLGEYQKQLASAVSMLRSALEEIAEQADQTGR